MVDIKWLRDRRKEGAGGKMGRRGRRGKVEKERGGVDEKRVKEREKIHVTVMHFLNSQ